MQRYAIFVDAGYLYSAGSSALSGIPQPRHRIGLKIPVAIAQLKSSAKAKTIRASLLRIYWYDGLLPSGITSQQQSLAESDDVKLRLGVVNTSGQQKGVDSLIVTDLVELARNHAISDAVVISGDEDVRVGVQIAQSFGVRVHLIGIEPQNNQSRSLAQESDTTTEWGVSTIQSFLSLAPDSAAADKPIVETAPSEVSVGVKFEPVNVDAAIAHFLGILAPKELKLLSDINRSESIPKKYDGLLLGIAKRTFGRELNRNERHFLRARFKLTIRTSTD